MWRKKKKKQPDEDEDEDSDYDTDEDSDTEDKDEDLLEEDTKPIGRPKKVVTAIESEDISWKPYIRPNIFGVVNDKTKETIISINKEEAILTILSKILSYTQETAQNTR